MRVFLFFSLFLAGRIFATECDFKLPKAFHMNETFFSGILPFVYNLTMTSVDEKPLYYVKSKIFRLHSTFHLKDQEGNNLGKARARYISWGTNMSLFGCNDEPLGKVLEQRVLTRRLHSLGREQEYKILNAVGEELGDILKTTVEMPDGKSKVKYTVRHKTEGVVAIMQRGWHNLITDKWEISIERKDLMDPRLYLFFPAYKTRVDSVLSPESSPELSEKLKIYQDLYQDQ